MAEIRAFVPAMIALTAVSYTHLDVYKRQVLLGCAISLFGGGGNSNSYMPVSAEVEAYEPLIQQYARQHGIPEYTELIKAVMMQESGGRGNDPMQASECGYNTRYPNTPNGITDPEYSIDVGIQNLAACLSTAEVENPIDMEHIKLALQGYNFGNGYISWAKTNYGGYSYANAVEFSTTQAERLGWDSYGDTPVSYTHLDVYKRQINNRRLNKADFEQTILIPMAEDGLDKYRTEYNLSLIHI